MKKLVLAVLACLMMSACGGSKAPSVDKKTKDEYSGKEVYKLLKKHGFQITTEFFGGVAVTEDGKEPYIDSSTIAILAANNKIVNILFNGKDHVYFVNYENEKDDMAVIRITDNNSCYYDVVQGKDGKPINEAKPSPCDKVDIESAKDTYVEFYEFLKENNLSRGELIEFAKWSIEDLL